MKTEIQPKTPCPVCHGKLNPMRPTIPVSMSSEYDNNDLIMVITICPSCSTILEYQLPTDKVFVMSQKKLKAFQKASPFLYTLIVHASTIK